MDWLGAAGGALEGVQGEMRHQDTLKMQQERMEILRMQQEIRSQLEQLKEGGRNDRSRETNLSRREIADANRKQRADAVVANTDLGYARIGSNEQIAGQRDSTVQRGQDIGAEQYWDAAGRDWSKSIMGDTTRRRGQDIGASTAARGQDLVHGDRQDALDVSSEGNRARSALGVLGLKARQKPGIFGTSGDPTDWANEFDRLYTGGATPDDLDQGGDQPVTRPEMPPSGAAPIPGARPSMPRPRPQPQAAGGASPKNLVVGATVKLRNGQTVVVKKVNPDGTFEY